MYDRAMGQSGSGNTFNITVNAGSGGAEIAKEVEKTMRRLLVNS
jgi:hypothetical protein